MSDCADIRLEMLNIDRIKPDNRDIQANIGLRKFLTKKIFPGRFQKDIFKTVERLE